MWKHIRIEHNDYIIKKISMDGHHKVLLSSFVNMWGEEITSASLYQRCKCFNPLVEGDEETVSQWTLSQIHDKTNAQISIKECENAQVMEINSKLAGVPFTVKFYLKVMTSQEIYDEITLPLLLMVQQLQAQKHLLFDLLKKKDIEITEYKLEGAQLSRRNIETLAFIESHFEKLCTTIKIPDEFPLQPTQLFTQEMQNLYDNVMEKYANCKKLKEAAEQHADAEDSETQSVINDSSPEKKQKKNPKQEESLSETQNQSFFTESQTKIENKIKPEQNNRSDEHQKKEEERLMKCRKDAMKKKQLNL
ncbi:hypothetical protein B7P43_G15233 [Cryptotermes secundus]|uniref:Non-homologous end-joining factor 1 n=1 Tax=Cryptotermes secundus TaxID=105785 RepID=A0A2J7QIU0_9NEOP|nr:uncharacterized protein LOC111867283 isoform X1 [Cryptotermes secundus]PNF28500.1 hypothetical protein B7P43_G15233 [Cryptotermes secundus]